MAQIRPDIAARGYADGIAVGLAPAIFFLNFGFQQVI
jgi:hypothetical protein